MKALVLKEYKRFSFEEVPAPEPSPEEVLVAVKACGICGSDVHGMDGSTGRRRPPIIMGHEAAGVIASAGRSVTGWASGDRVTFDSTIYCGECAYCREGLINLCDRRRVLGVSCEDYRQHGAFAEFVAVPPRILYRVPEGLPFEHAAMVEPFAIALHAIRRSPPALNDTVVVVGAGMIGLALVQGLAHTGCGKLIVLDMFGHMTDVGGKVPGSLPTDARTIYEEGVTVPPVKIYKKGVLNDDVLKIMLHNCRLPHWNLSDFNAITAALRTAATRCVEISERFGDDVFYSAMDEMLERNKRAMRELIKRTVPEKKQHFEDYICDDGLNMGPYKIACTMWREGDTCIFDFEGTDPQSISSINFLLNEEMFKMFAGVYMIMVFDPQILFNDGFYDLMEVRIPAGTLLKPLKPAALSCRTHALGRIFDILGGLLGQGNPQFMCAAGFSDSPHFMYSGHDKNGDWYQLYQITFGGIPGKPFGDGPDGHSLWPAFTNVPNEFLESYFPLRIDIYETIPDTGGPGKNRGGNGLRIGYRFLEPGEISIHDDRWLTYPWGVNGGLPGARSKKTLVRTDGSEELLHSKLDHIKVEAGDLLLSDTWGGGGCGDPLERDPEKVKFDVDAGLATVEGAKRYGVVLKGDASVDVNATTALRQKMAAARGAVKLFDRGFDSIEELKSRCLAETGLQPPTQPKFTNWALKAARGKSITAKPAKGKAA